MDDRKKIILELEDKKRADIEARNRLFQELGETLLNRIGEGEPFSETSGESPGGILADYRELQKEIAQSADIIKGLEADIVRLKELESAISSKEEEQSRYEKELEEVHVRFGKALLLDSDLDSVTGDSKVQEESLLVKIEEQEKRLKELEEHEGGILAWLGKNAQIAVSKTLLLKHRSALQRVYRSTGKKFLAEKPVEILAGEAAEAAEKAQELGKSLSTLAVDLAMLKGERRNMGDIFGPEGSPSRRIQGLEKHISHIKGEFPAVYLRFGLLAEDSGMKDALSSILKDEDGPVLESADSLKTEIAKKDMEIEKIKAAISIDEDNAEIEKKRKAIQGQEQKIAAAREVIAGLEKQIAETEQHIEELKKFLRENE